MNRSTVRTTDEEIERTVKKYSAILFKISFTLLCSSSDAEDAVSDTFLRYITKPPVLNDDDHIRAWLIRVAINVCKDKLRFNARHRFVNLEDVYDFCASEPEREVLEEVLKLPAKYKSVIHLYYIEGYKTKEISEILQISPAAVRKRLQYGRKLLKLEYWRNDVI